MMLTNQSNNFGYNPFSAGVRSMFFFLVGHTQESSVSSDGGGITAAGCGKNVSSSSSTLIYLIANNQSKGEATGAPSRADDSGGERL